MYEIAKTFTFAAAHRLSGLPEGHKCSRPHGHTYTVEIALADTQLSGPGMVANFDELDPFGAFIADTLDHRDLNQVLDFSPTCELIASYLGDWYIENLQDRIGGRLASVTVRESASTRATYTPDAKDGNP